MSDAPTQAVSVPPGLPYGQRKSSEQAQAVQPMAGSPTAASQSGSRVPLPGRLGPGEVPALEDPSAYPDEPVTAGLAVGPGAGPDALLTGPFGPESLSLLRLVYGMFHDEDVRRLIERTEMNL